MSSGTRLVVGLGNPGPDYAGTRHNVGAETIRDLADRLNVALAGTDGPAVLGRTGYRGVDLALAIPTTYMNRSGGAVRFLVEALDLDPSRLLVVVDDLNLSLGALRLRPSGGAGGHNGTQDVIDRLGSQAFPRLRIGIGGSYPRGGQSDYVLSPFDPEERPVADETVETAGEAALCFAAEGAETAMNRFNRSEPPGDHRSAGPETADT